MQAESTEVTGNSEAVVIPNVNGLYPRPTIEVREGDTLVITVLSKLDIDVTGEPLISNSPCMFPLEIISMEFIPLTCPEHESSNSQLSFPMSWRQFRILTKFKL